MAIGATFDYSQSYQAVSHTFAFYDSLSTSIVSPADIPNNPVTNFTVQIQQPAQTIKLVFDGYFDTDAVSPYLPTTSAFYAIDPNASVAFEVYAQAAAFPDVRTSFASVYPNTSAYTAALNAYKNLDYAWYANTTNLSFTRVDVKTPSGTLGQITFSVPTTGIVSSSNKDAILNENLKIIASNFNDTIQAGKGDDTIVGGAGNYVLSLGQGVDTVNLTGNGNSLITGGAGASFISIHGSGNNTIVGGSGAVTVTLVGNGSNTVNFRQSPPSATLLLFGGSGNDTISGGFGDDTINAGSGNDVISGGEGNDTIYAGSGNDIVSGIGVNSSDLEHGNNLIDGTAYGSTANLQVVYLYSYALYNVRYTEESDSKTWVATVTSRSDPTNSDTIKNFDQIIFPGSPTITDQTISERGLVALAASAIQDAFDAVSSYVGKATGLADYLPSGLAQALKKVAGWFNYAKLAADFVASAANAPDLETAAKTVTIMAVNQLVDPIIDQATSNLNNVVPDINGSHAAIDKISSDLKSNIDQSVISSIDAVTNLSLQAQDALFWNVEYNKIFQDISNMIQQKYGDIKEFVENAVEPQANPNDPPPAPSNNTLTPLSTIIGQLGVTSSSLLTFSADGSPIITLTPAMLATDATKIAAITGRYILAVNADSSGETIQGGSGVNALSAGTDGGLHTLLAGPGVLGTDTLYGGAGADTLSGSTSASGTAVLIAGAGFNVLDGGVGYDTLYGGGQSLLNAGASNQQLLGGYSVTSSDTLRAGSGNFEFLATVAGHDQLNAGSGVGDFLEGGSGADTLIGSTTSSGSAVLVGGTGANLLLGGAGADTLVGGGASSLVAGTGPNQELLGGFSVGAHDTLNAGSSNAVLGVAEGNNLLLAGTGKASLFAGSGNDSLQGGGGNGVLVGGTGASTLQAGSGNDFLVGGGHSLELGGSGPGASVLTGGYSASAHDTLKAGTGSGETLAVVMGNNTLYADSTSLGVNDVLYAGTGNDTLYGAGYGNGSVTGPIGLTAFVVGQGNSTVLGGAGNDYVAVLNGIGSSSIDGGGGANTVQFTGHSAADATIKTNASGVTTITFADSTQTATLTHVTGLLFQGDSVVRLLG